MKSSALAIDALSTVVEQMPDDRLKASRHDALNQLRQSGMPTVREEDWKYTDLATAIDITNEWLQAGAAARAPAATANEPSGIDADWIHIVNGRPVAGVAIPGLTVSALSDAAATLEYGGRLDGLNIALLHDGLHLQVAPAARIERPIGLLIHDSADDGPGVSQIRIVIEAGANSSAEFVEYHASTGNGDQFANAVVSVRVDDGASVSHVRIQDRARHHTLTGHLGVAIGRDALFRHAGFDLGGQLIRNDVCIDLERPGSRTTFAGLYLVGDGQHIDNHTRVDHRVGPAESQQEYRGILAGKARGVWNGKAIVHEGADGTDAQQANHNLLLSEKAEINAKPELEIYADDVKCSHGTTVGQLDESALFYLRSRGLDRHEARQLLTRAFAQAIVSQSPVDSLHEYLSERIARRLDEITREAQS